MAAASSPSNNATLKYDVFLSFSGEDTRQGFANTLFHVLKTKGIETFIDDELSRGKQIETSLMRTIEESMIAVVIFSEKYASSSWCLDELVKIKECSLIIIPIFYKVKPEHVLQQLGKFGLEFSKLKRNHSKMKMKKWSDDLAFAATQSGWDLNNYRTEMDLIKEVAACIVQKLDSVSFSNLSFRFIGIASIVDDLRKLLTDESSTVQFLGIWGMGGLGKTTIAEALFHQLSRQFDECYFAALALDVTSHGLVSLRNDIISHVLGEYFAEGTPNQPRISVLRRLQKKKVLIILDNVSTCDQVTTLVGTKADRWFAPGSKVVVTSRDFGVFRNEDMTVFKMKQMSKYYSLRLFCLHAFKQNQPVCDGDYIRLSNEMVDCAKGVPLALKTLGSNLFGRPKNQWQSTLEKLRRSLEPTIEKVLEISYEFLEDTEKEIFLDIACFFKGDDKDRVQDILDGCGFSATIGITRLIEKCLVAVSVGNKLAMHDLLQKMGWDIVEKQAKSNFGMRRRSWKPNDSYNLLTSYQEAESTREKEKTFEEKAKAIEGIFFIMFKMKKFNIHPMAFSKMQNLRLLKFDESYGINKEIKIHGEVLYLPNNLRFLHWFGYPCEHLPSNFSAENIVELSLHESKLTQMWKGVELSLNLRRLKVLDLQGSRALTELPNLTSAINLEKLILNNCLSLLEIPTSIQNLRSLSLLSLRNCMNLHILPSLVNLKILSKLDLFGCESLKKFPETSREIEELDLNHTAVVEWPYSMSYLNNLKTLHVPYVLETLPCTLQLGSLKKLYLFCRLQKFPQVIGGVRELYLDGTEIRELPSSIVLLSSLVELDLQSCRKLEKLPNNFGQLNCLEKLCLTGCSELFKRPLSLSGLRSIKKLYLERCKIMEFPVWVCTLSSLQVLNLSQNYFVSVPESIKQLSLLESLDLSDCINLRSLPELPSQMHDLVVSRCESLNVESSLFIKDGELRKTRANKFDLSSHRFCFVGCEGLGEGARTSIVKNAMVRIQNMTRDENLRFPLTVSLPGNEVPASFKYHEGSSITMELPTNWCNNMFKGFVFGVIANEVEELNPTMFLESRNSMAYRCFFKNNNGSYLDSYSASFKFDEYWTCEHLSFPRSRTLVLQYSGDIYSPDSGNQFCGENSLDFFEDIFPSRGNQLCRKNHKEATHAIFCFDSPGWKVLKCGVRLVYAELEDQNNLSIVNSANIETERRISYNGLGFALLRGNFIKLLCGLAQCFGIQA